MSVTDERHRSLLRLAFDRSVGGIFWGKVFTTTGMWMHSVIAAVVVFDATGSALMVGIVTSAQFVPQLLLSPWAGALADRGHGVRQVMIGRVLCLVASTALAVAATLGALGGPYATALLFFASLLLGTGFAVGGAPMHAMVATMVQPAELPAAMALNSAPMTVARITGPIAGAFIIGPFGAAVAFVVAAACHVVFYVLLRWVIVFPSMEPTPAGTRADRRLRVDRGVFALLLAVAVAVAVAEPSLVLAPALSREFGLGVDGVAAMSLAFGIGAAAGLGVAPPVMRRYGEWLPVPGGLLLLGASCLVVGLVSDWSTVLIALGVGGIGFSLVVSAATTLVQRLVPDGIRGRVMAWWMISFVGARPLGAAIFGVSSDLTWVGGGFAASAAVAIAVAAALALSIGRRARIWQTDANDAAMRKETT